jgi:hypothetical protein
MLAARQALAVRRVGVAVTRLLISIKANNRTSWPKRRFGSDKRHQRGAESVGCYEHGWPWKCCAAQSKTTFRNAKKFGIAEYVCLFLIKILISH